MEGAPQLKKKWELRGKKNRDCNKIANMKNHSELECKYTWKSFDNEMIVMAYIC